MRDGTRSTSAQSQMSDVQSPPGYLISCASAGPSGSAPKSTPNFSLSVRPPLTVSTSICAIVAPCLDAHAHMRSSTHTHSLTHAVMQLATLFRISCVKKKWRYITFSRTRYRALGPELIPVYRQSARRCREENHHAIYLAVVCHCFLPGLRLPS